MPPIAPDGRQVREIKPEPGCVLKVGSQLIKGKYIRIAIDVPASRLDSSRRATQVRGSP
jgi:hypothetical protein